jgi:hypothetical protein
MDPKEERILDKLDEVNGKIEALLEGAAGEDLNSTQKELLKRYDCQVEFLQQQLTNTAQGALYVSPPLTLSILPYHS